MTIYTSTDTTVLAHHKEECIECQSSNITDYGSPSSDEGYQCEDCDMTVARESGSIVARGDMSEETMRTFSFSEKF